MNKNGRHIANAALGVLPTHSIEQLKAAFEQVMQAIHRRVTYEWLCGQFESRILNAALARISTFHQDLYGRLFGPPAGSQRILIDECMGNKWCLDVHKTLGPASTMRALILRSGIKDFELFKSASWKNFSGIVTIDGAAEDFQDLSVIANKAYQDHDWAVKRGFNIKALPGVIVFPRAKEDIKKYFAKHQIRMQQYLDEPITQVLDLRNI